METMTSREFADAYPTLARVSHTDRILAFGWFLMRHKQVEVFTSGDVTGCIDEARLLKPSSVAPFLTSMSKRGKPVLLKRRNGYVIEQRTLSLLDKKYGQRVATAEIDKLLSELPSKIPLADEREYLEEALTCFRHRAFRAAIVMSWNVAYAHLCSRILQTHLSSFNNQLPLSFPKADIQSVTTLDDFQLLRESQVLQVCSSARIISSSLHKVMKGKLDRRNVSAHPSGIAVTPLTAEEFIRDVIENVVLKL